MRQCRNKARPRGRLNREKKVAADYSRQKVQKGR
ncbi:MAG: hypothetical protein ACLSD6_09705 [Clostridium sp.]